MGRAYFVDFENVSEQGLYGIETLTPKDRVILFYSQQNISLPATHLCACIHAQMKAEHFQIKKIADNYLDFQLATYLGFYAAKHPKKSLVIVSKDNDFIPVIDFWSAKGRKIWRQETILGISLASVRTDELPPKPPRPQEFLTEERKEAIRELVKDDHLTINDYRVIYQALLKHSQGSAFRQELEQHIYKGKGRALGIKLSDFHQSFWSTTSPPMSAISSVSENSSDLDKLLAKIHANGKTPFTNGVKKEIRRLLQGIAINKTKDMAPIYQSIYHSTTINEYQLALLAVMPEKKARAIYQRTVAFFLDYHGLS